MNLQKHVEGGETGTIIVTIDQAVCFPDYGIPKTKRTDYITMDRSYLRGFLDASLTRRRIWRVTTGPTNSKKNVDPSTMGRMISLISGKRRAGLSPTGKAPPYHDPHPFADIRDMSWLNGGCRFTSIKAGSFESDLLRVP